MMEAIGKRLEQVEIGTETTFHNLTMFPLRGGGGGGEPDYFILDEALEVGCAKVSEVSAGGSVPELKFVNESDRPVFLLDGEELIGAKQNRILNLTILAPANSSLVIPVSCVEQGRWNYRSREFSSAPRTHYATGRAMKMSHVTQSLETSGEAHSDQGAVWADISSKTARLRSSSPTQAMSAMYEQHSTSIEDYVSAFTPLERQVGAAFAINGKIIGFDLFDYGVTLQKLLGKLVRSYAIDAIDTESEKFSTPNTADVRSLLSAVSLAEAKTFPATGKGEDVRLTGDNVTGGGLIADGRLVHLSAFVN